MIDVHIHAVNAQLPGAKPGALEGVDLDARPDVVAATLRTAMKSAGVTHALAMGRASAPADDPLGINGTLRLAALVPGLHAVGVADPTKLTVVHADHFRRAEADMAAGKVVALKAYTGYHHYGADSPPYRPYIRLAAKYKLPFIFHSGDTWSTRAKVRFADPLLVDDVAVDHPDVNFVIAHFGTPWLMDASTVVLKNDNVWADLSGLIVGTAAAFRTDADGKPPADSLWGLMQNDFLKALAYAEKYDRYLYGSDWPLAPMAHYRAFVESFVPKQHRQAVFEDNARKLFRLK